MVCRLGVLGSFVLVVCACQKDRDDVNPSSSASGTAISASANGSGSGGGSGGATGDGGAAASTTGDGGAGPTASSGGEGGDGGDPSGTGGSGPAASTGTGGNPTTCGADVACWGDDASLCTTSICTEAFIECAPGEPSPFAYACGQLNVVYREGVWAHVVDCMRDAGPDVECEDGEAALDACLEQAHDEACDSPAADAVCDDAETSCPGFDVDTCKADLKLLLETSVGDYDGCVDAGGDCATLHNVCYYGTPDP